MAVTVTITDDGLYELKGRAYNLVQAKNEALAPYQKQVIYYGLKLRLVPTEEQATALNQQIGNARFVRNRYLADRIAYYKEHKESDPDGATLTPSEYKKNWLPKLKEEFDFLNLSDKFALENAIFNVDDAYKRFFKGQNNFPKFASRFKPNGNRYQTNYTNGNLGLVCGNGIRDYYAKIPKVGQVKVILPLGETPDTLIRPGVRIGKASISRSGQNYYISFSLEEVVDLYTPIVDHYTSQIMGLDLGLKYFCSYGTLDSKVKVENPRWIKKHERRLRRFQQALARKQYDSDTHKGSKNYYKALEKVQKEQRKIANERKDFHHKLSRVIADSCTMFVCEDLNIKGMMQNRHLSKAIASVGWGEFIEMVKYKVERNNGVFLQVSRWFPSSKLCTCGYKKDDLTLQDRFWECPVCHTIHDRDDHAVDNMILHAMAEKAGDGYIFFNDGPPVRLVSPGHPIIHIVR